MKHDGSDRRKLSEEHHRAVMDLIGPLGTACNLWVRTNLAGSAAGRRNVGIRFVGPMADGSAETVRGWTVPAVSPDDDATIYIVVVIGPDEDFAEWSERIYHLPPELRTDEHSHHHDPVCGHPEAAFFSHMLGHTFVHEYAHALAGVDPNGGPDQDGHDELWFHLARELSTVSGMDRTSLEAQVLAVQLSYPVDAARAMLAHRASAMAQ